MGRFGYTSNMDLDEKLLIAIVRASETYKKSSSLLLKNFGLTFSQYTVLRVLEGSEKGTNTITNIGNVMLVSGANMTGIAKRMEKIGLILSKSDPADERRKLLEVTPRGKQKLKDITAEKNNLIHQFLKNISTDKRKELLEFSKILIANGNELKNNL
jgi:DNA-binding MarR family transcriptional regulator